MLLQLQAFAAAYPVTRTDALGKRVTLHKPPMRIVSLAPSNTEIVAALGLADRLVGVTNFCDYPPEVKKLPRVGGYANTSVEQIVALSPDLVLAVFGNPDWLLQRLEDLDVPVFGLNPTTLDGVQRDIRMVADLCGASSEGVRLVQQFAAEIEAVTRAVVDATGRPVVYFGAWEPPFFSPGPGSFIYDMIELAGGENLTRYYEKSWVPLNLEEIIARDPEIIIHGMEGVPEGRRDNSGALRLLRSRAGWRTTAAVRTGRVHLLDDNVLQRPGPRLPQGLRQLAETIHPECFR